MASGDEEAAVQKGPRRRRKCKNHLVQLSDMYPDITYRVAGHYGPPDDEIYVMEVEVGSSVHQGIGPSKIKAKVMAAELALMNLGLLESLTTSPMDIVEAVCSADDFTSDSTETLLYYEFSKPYPTASACVPWATDDTGSTQTASVSAAGEHDGDDDGVNGTEEEDWSRYIGKNPLTIIVERCIDARYQLLAETGDQLHPLFAMSVTIDGETFRAAASSKKLAKARAARNALNKIYSVEFTTAENGMPVYAGSEDLWETYKAQLEKDAELLVQPGRNPLLLMSDLFPEALYQLSTAVDASHFYEASVSVLERDYVGVGTTKTDAKTNAAANALEDLQLTGLFALRQRQLTADRQNLPPIQLTDSKLFGLNKNAVGKLNILYRDRARYCDLAETPVRETSFTAFTVAVTVDGRHYIGVGKTKKAARSVAAERALVHLGLWTDDDDSAKLAATLETDEDPIAAVHRMRCRSAQERQSKAWDDGRWSSQLPHGAWTGGWTPGSTPGWDDGPGSDTDWSYGPGGGWDPGPWDSAHDDYPGGHPTSAAARGGDSFLWNADSRSVPRGSRQNSSRGLQRGNRRGAGSYHLGVDRGGTGHHREWADNSTHTPRMMRFNSPSIAAEVHASSIPPLIGFQGGSGPSSGFHNDSSLSGGFHGSPAPSSNFHGDSSLSSGFQGGSGPSSGFHASLTSSNTGFPDSLVLPSTNFHASSTPIAPLPNPDPVSASSPWDVLTVVPPAASYTQPTDYVASYVAFNTDPQAAYTDVVPSYGPYGSTQQQHAGYGTPFTW